MSQYSDSSRKTVSIFRHGLRLRAYRGVMPRRSGQHGSEPPRFWCPPGGTWPEVSPDAPPEALAAAALAVNLREEIGARPVAEVAAAAGLHRSTIYKLLRGETWASLRELARLEAVLGSLWPGPG